MKTLNTWLFTAPYLELMRASHKDFDDAIRGGIIPAEACARYPDGSMEFIGTQVCRLVYETLKDSPSNPDIPIDTEHLMKLWAHSLWHQADVSTQIEVYAPWVEKLDDGVLAVHFRRGYSGFSWQAIDEEPPENTIVTFCFLKRLKKDDVATIREIVRSYINSMNMPGVVSSGPVTLRSGLFVARKAIQFRVDTSQTDYRAINWLILSLIKACETCPMDLISFLPAVDVMEDAQPTYRRITCEEYYGPFDTIVDLGADK